MSMTLSKRHPPLLQARRNSPGSLTLNEASFEVLFQQHWNRLCAVLYRLLGDWAEAEDLALETFVQLYRRPPQQEHNLGGWLYRVATNLGLNTLRRRRRRQCYEERAGAFDLDQESEQDPATLLEQAQERNQVRATLSSMKPRSAQALILRHSGLSYAEIAAALQVSPASVGALLARASAEFQRNYERRR